MNENRKELISLYAVIRDRVEEMLFIFNELKKNGRDDELFEELVFCLMTPQTNARQAEKAMRILKRDLLLYRGSREQISEKLNLVRFRNSKAGYICKARSLFMEEGGLSIRAVLDSRKSSQELRDWLYENIDGFGYKEASHFLRNTGYETSFAILDRHVIRNLVKLEVIDNDARSLTRKNYIDIENRMKLFSEEIGIPMRYLDYVFIFRDTGDVFK